VPDFATGAAVLVIPILTPSQNQWQTWHWARRRRWSGQALLLLRNAIQHVGRADLPSATGRYRVAVTITRYGHNTLDHGNLVGGCKGLLDLLVQEGLLVDDAPKWVDDTYLQYIERCNQRQRTEVSLEW
jgi:hypothetical protein